MSLKDIKTLTEEDGYVLCYRHKESIPVVGCLRKNSIVVGCTSAEGYFYCHISTSNFEFFRHLPTN